MRTSVGVCIAFAALAIAPPASGAGGEPQISDDVLPDEVRAGPVTANFSTHWHPVVTYDLGPDAPRTHVLLDGRGLRFMALAVVEAGDFAGHARVRISATGHHLARVNLAAAGLGPIGVEEEFPGELAGAQWAVVQGRGLGFSVLDGFVSDANSLTCFTGGSVPPPNDPPDPGK